MSRYVFFIGLFTVFLICLPTNNVLVSKKHFNLASKAAQKSILQIKQRSPVVNEGNRIKLSVIDSSGNPINNGVIWKSGSPDIASVDLTSGEILGVKSGFATITATQNGESSSVFLTVSKVRKANGSNIPGDTKTDGGGSIYISSPTQNIILKAENSLNAKVHTFAGTTKVAGNRNGLAKEALFAGPTAIGVDNSTNGGLYIADTLNHNIRKIGFNNQVETVLGKNAPGTSVFAGDGKIDLGKLLLNSPRGVVTDNGGNFYIADTDNHAIYYVDIAKGKVNIIAGEPGQSGKEDGIGRSARFKRPAGMALSSDGRLLTVADEDNNRVRLIDISRNSNDDLIGDVSTLGVASSSKKLADSSLESLDLGLNKLADEIIFDKPQSVSIDGLGNIYVVDNRSVQLITRPIGQMPEAIELAQPNVTFGKAVSVTVKGTEAFVLDTNSKDSEALKVVSVGAPEVLRVEPDIISVGQTTQLTIQGKNFSPESQIVFGGQALPFTSVKAEEIKVQLPVQGLPGRITLSILTRGGLAQKEINAVSKPVNLLAPDEITTIAGGAIFLGNGGTAEFANLGSPIKTVADSSGNLFISDRGARTIRRVDKQTQIITTVAGGGESLGDGVLATTALVRPSSIAISKSGDLFIVDSSLVIRKVNMLTGVITTVAGNIGRGFSGDGGLAINAGFSGISDIAFDPKGNLLVLEANYLRLIDASTGIIQTIAGTGRSEFSGDKGLAVNASFMFAVSLAIDGKGNIFISDFLSNRVRKINKKGIITTVVGDGQKQQTMSSEERDGKKATNISLYSPSNIAVDLKGNIFIQDNGSLTAPTTVISRVDLKAKIINTQKINGKESDGQMVKPKDAKLSTDGLGNLFFTSTAFNVFQLNIKSEMAIRVAGNTKFNFFGDNGLAVFAALGDIADVVSDLQGNIYIGDFINGRVRRIDSNTHVITSFVGKDGAQILGNNVAMAENISIAPTALAIKGKNLLISEFQNNTWFIRQLDLTTNTITTIAGSNAGTFSDGKPALETNFNSIGSITTDSQDNIYLLDGNRIRQIDAKTSIVTTIANVSLAGLPANDLVIDKNGDIFISVLGNLNSSAEQGGAVLRFDIKTKQFSLVAGGKGILFEGDRGLATNASLGYVESISLDASGNLFIGAYTPFINGQGVFKKIPRIWKVSRDTNIITTFINTKNGFYSGDGGSINNASLADCSKIFIDEKGMLFIINKDFLAQSIRLVKLSN